MTTRRNFLKTTAAAGTVAYFPWKQAAFANASANDRPVIGCIGVGSMGTGDARGHANFGDVVAVCDVDSRHADRARNDEKIGKGKPHEGHKDNFYRCIREGGLPVSDVYTHVQAMNCCHLCGIAARLGRTIQWDPKAERIVGDEQAAALFARVPRQGYEIPRV